MKDWMGSLLQKLRHNFAADIYVVAKLLLVRRMTKVDHQNKVQTFSVAILQFGH